MTGVGEDVKKKEPSRTIGGNADCCNHYENIMEFSQKIKNETTLWANNCTSGNTFEDTWNTDSWDYMYPYVHCSSIYNSQDLQAAQVFISRWVGDKIKYCSSIKYKEILPFMTSWMNLEDIILSEISQSEKDKYHILLLICGI